MSKEKKEVLKRVLEEVGEPSMRNELGVGGSTIHGIRSGSISDRLAETVYAKAKLAYC